jgi:hypothetical protein
MGSTEYRFNEGDTLSRDDGVAVSPSNYSIIGGTIVLKENCNSVATVASLDTYRGALGNHVHLLVVTRMF